MFPIISLHLSAKQTLCTVYTDPHIKCILTDKSCLKVNNIVITY